jgi:hypothetical protein
MILRMLIIAKSEMHTDPMPISTLAGIYKFILVIEAWNKNDDRNMQKKYRNRGMKEVRLL